MARVPDLWKPEKSSSRTLDGRFGRLQGPAIRFGVKSSFPMKLRLAIVIVVAVVLAVLLMSSPTTPRVGRVGFYLGIATLLAWLVTPGGEIFVRLSQGGTVKRALAAAIIIMVGSALPIVLVEAGIAGYIGFASFMRYVALSVAILGITWLALGVAFPLLLRRKSRDAST